jgi:HSP20 family protein
MLSRYADIDRSFALFDEIRKRMDRVWEDYEDGGRAASLTAGWPRVNLLDDGKNLYLTADVPGMSEADINITFHDGALTLKGERKVTVPEGYHPQRQERSGIKFSRTVSLPVAVDAEKSTATVKDGVLTVTLAKAPEAQPRRIAVRAAQ